jgi:aspartate racemase
LKTIGLIGGLSYQSTIDYYKIINEEIATKEGGLNSGKIIIDSHNFAPLAELQTTDNWDEISRILIESAKKLEYCGADMVAICTNTMHKVAEQIQDSIKIPLIHIADATAAAIKQDNIKTVALLGTKYTMQMDFYKKRLYDKFNITVITPSKIEQDFINETIFKELCLGKITPTAKEKFINIIENIHQKGAEGIILGCTEIPLLVSQKDSKIKLYNTTEIHSQACVKFIYD